MNPLLLSAKVEAFFDNIDRKIHAFRTKTGIDCPFGCGSCCQYPRIETTILEFIPLARFLWDKDRAIDFYRCISSDDNICALYRGEKAGIHRGMCAFYDYRGFLCRTFGFLARKNRKDGICFSTCPVIKENHKEKIASLNRNAAVQSLPVYPSIRKQFISLYPRLCTQTFPINISIKRAIEFMHNAGYKPILRTQVQKCA